LMKQINSCRKLRTLLSVTYPASLKLKQVLETLNVTMKTVFI